MFSRMFDYFRDEEDNDPSFIRLAQGIVIFVVLVNVALLPLVSGLTGEEGARNPPAFVVLSITLILEGISLFLTFRGNVIMTKITVPFALIAAITVISLNTNGLKNAAMIGLPIVLVISAILLGRRAIFLTTPFAIIAVIIVAAIDLRGVITFIPVGLDDAIIIPILLLGCAGVVQLLIARLNDSIKRARESEKLEREKNIELNELRASLEERVNRRTAELETATQFSLRRARQLEAVAQVNRAIASIQDLDILLPRIAQVISEQFNVYHTGIFLLDGNREFAVLCASNSTGGKKMLARGYKLRVGQTDIVGFVTATGQPRIALDTGSDPTRFDNPDLPDTRSEITLPLRHGQRTIGVLDVQSVEPNAFGQNDMEVLITLADQVSAAINTTLILEDAKKALAESQSALAKTVQETWKVMRPASLGIGYKLENSMLLPLEQHLEDEHVHEAMAKGAPVASNDEDAPSSMAIPISLRGRVIGVINLSARKRRKLTSDDADIARAVTERLSLAIETATLLQSTQHRADIERVTTEISSKISSSTQFEIILQTAAQELSKALGGSDVLVQIEPVSMELGMSG